MATVGTLGLLVITQVARPGFKFRLSFFLRSVTNRRLVSKAHAPTVHTYSTWNLQRLSSRKVSTDSMISRAMKSHTNEHTVQGRPILKDVKRFRNGSLQALITRDQFTSEHFE